MDAPALRKQRQIISERVDQSKPASIVIHKFGGLKRFCDLTGLAMSTVHGWTVSGYIPSRRQAHILTVAKASEIALEPADFVERPAEPAEPAAVNG